MNKYLLGVDGGASKTRALIASQDGVILSSGFAGCSNKNITSMEAAILQVRLGVIEALAKSDALPHQIVCAHYGLGGIASEESIQAWLVALQDLTPQATITIENDVFLAIYATNQTTGIAVTSGSGGNIGAISPKGTFHANGHVRFNSSQLGRQALQKIMAQFQAQRDPSPFAKDLLDLAKIDEGNFRQAMRTRPKDLAAEVSPHLIQLYRKGHSEAQEILLSWLKVVEEDVQAFRQSNDLEALPICFAGSTFSSMKDVLQTQLQIQGEILVAPVSPAEGAIKAAARTCS